MMEFITAYQILLIAAGVLIIMGLVGYLAEEREKAKNGEKPPKKKKENKKEKQVETVVEQDAVDVVEKNDDVVELQNEMESAVEMDATSEVSSNTVEDENSAVMPETYNMDEEQVTTDDNYANLYEMNVSANDEVINANLGYNVVTEESSYSTEENNVLPVEEQSSLNQEVSHEEPTIPNMSEMVAVENTTNSNNDDALRAFMEPVSPVSNNDTFGADDMSSFRVESPTTNDSNSGNIDAWKL